LRNCPAGTSLQPQAQPQPQPLINSNNGTTKPFYQKIVLGDFAKEGVSVLKLFFFANKAESK